MDKAKLLKNPFLLAMLGIYLSYLVHGMGVITLAQNMSHLAAKLGTDDAGISTIISGIGLGRLVSILFFGAISDKFGRRSVILLGLISYMVFFFGILASPNLVIAYALAVCAGAANAALDTGGYPALMEAAPKASGSSVILVKAMVSFGQMFYPLLVSFLLVNHLWYGFAMLIPGVILLAVTVIILVCRFPSQVSDGKAAGELPVMKTKPLIWLEGVSSVIFGVGAFSTFYVIVTWMPKYAVAFGGMTEAESLITISYYSLGSLVCVFLFAFLLKSMLRPVWANVLNASIAVIAGLMIYFFPSSLVCKLGSFAIGFSAAGGILQLGVAVMAEFFPKSKAMVTSIYMMAGGLSNFVIPLITAALSRIGLQYIILLDVAFAVVTLITGMIVFIRYYKVFSVPKNDIRLGEKYFVQPQS